jgi:Cu+-exporting ATPase
LAFVNGNTTKATLDPVCGMTVQPATAAHRAEHAGVPYFFCSASCQAKFVASPGHYLDTSRKQPHPTEGATYTCPMHPQIRHDGPGFCPICGMALEPLAATAEAAPNPEFADMVRRFWIAVVLAAPVFILAMGDHMGLHHIVPPMLSLWIQFALATPVVLWAGWPFFVRAAASVRNRALNMFSLIGLGVGVAYGLQPGRDFRAGAVHS